MIVHVFVSAVALLLTCVVGAKFPAEFERCHITDPNLDACLDKTIDNALKLIGSKGIPSLNLPSIDPIQVTSIVIGAGSKAVHLVQSYFDVKLVGLSKGKVVNSHLDLDKNTFTFRIESPDIAQHAKYNISGKILVLPAYGAGDSVVQMTNGIFESNISFKLETRNNKKYIVIDSYKVLFDGEKIHFDYQNLFNGDEKLAKNILTVINENYREVFDDVKDGVGKSYAEVAKAIASGFFHKISMDEIFLP